MSTNLAKEISCPKCGKSSQTRMWPSIDCADHPEQRERILEESLFIWECPDCGYQMQLVYPCLYHDRSHRLLVLMDPNQKEKSLNKRAIAAEKLDGVRKRIVGTVEELKEKILIFESGLNDAACELVKLAMAKTVEARQGAAPTAGYFSKADEKENKITFAFCFEDRLPMEQTTRYDVYRKTQEITEALHFNEFGSDFLRVDQEMAKMMLEEYQNR